MIAPNSSVKDIIFYIDQLLLLNLTDIEKKLINKFLSIESLLNQQDINKLIDGDIVDMSWFSKTYEIINSCKIKKIKSQNITKEIYNLNCFLIYRVLEDYLKKGSRLIYNSNEHMLSTITDGSLVLWSSVKIKERSLQNLQNEIFRKTNLSEIVFDLKWLHQNRSLFFNNCIFE